ncbi:hypothetical protein HO133_000717 [Letharia lupina]|uniref:Uncharacterized protein n=1 Tax=Letharia lupina TaxID=560253 RepID=A0A8H6CG00_9LECA|nr:uncharacterized protein HO133_000717 [Letharia lupina]KAF6222670.1 hypothetical protein HO133_000717 [Letharia lupina]
MVANTGYEALAQLLRSCSQSLIQSSSTKSSSVVATPTTFTTISTVSSVTTIPLLFYYGYYPTKRSEHAEITTFLLRLLPNQEVRARRDYHFSTTATTQSRGQSTQRLPLFYYGYYPIKRSEHAEITTFLLRLLPNQEVRARRDYHFSTTATTQSRGQSTQRLPLFYYDYYPIKRSEHAEITTFLLRLLPNQEVRARRDYYYSTTTFLLRLLPKQEVRARRDYHYSITDSTTATTQEEVRVRRDYHYSITDSTTATTQEEVRARRGHSTTNFKPVPKQWPELYQSSN